MHNAMNMSLNKGKTGECLHLYVPVEQGNEWKPSLASTGVQSMKIQPNWLDTIPTHASVWKNCNAQSVPINALFNNGCG